jgi:hypothetical protein
MSFVFSSQAVRTTSVCRVLVINRHDYTSLTSSFPISSKAVMDNLMDRAEAVSLLELGTLLHA